MIGSGIISLVILALLALAVGLAWNYSVRFGAWWDIWWISLRNSWRQSRRG